jgi:hypothetical protein
MSKFDKVYEAYMTTILEADEDLDLDFEGADDEDTDTEGTEEEPAGCTLDDVLAFIEGASQEDLERIKEACDEATEGEEDEEGEEGEEDEEGEEETDEEDVDLDLE